MREKLIELQLQADIENEVSENTTQHRGYIADLMIANGVTVRKKATWGMRMDNSGWFNYYACSNCGTNLADYDWNFCPNCGAEMSKDGDT